MVKAVNLALELLFAYGEDPEMAWQPLAYVTGASTDQIDSGTFDGLKFLNVEFTAKATAGTINSVFTFNSITTQSYAIREQVNGGSGSTNLNLYNTDNLSGTTNGTDGQVYVNCFISNVSGYEKLFWSWGLDNTGSGSGSVPDRKTISGHFIGTDLITSIQSNNGGTGDYQTATLSVYGSD